MILPRNAEDARLIGNYGASAKSWSRLVICVGGVSEELKDIVQEGELIMKFQKKSKKQLK